MWLKYPIYIAVFLFLGLVQYSFLPHFAVFGVVLNLVFILFFLTILFEKNNTYSEGIFLIVLAGCVLDDYIGASIISLSLVYIFIKIMAYFLKVPLVQSPITFYENKKEQDIFFLGYIVLIFLISFFFYHIAQYTLTNIYHFNINVVLIRNWQNIIVQMSFNATAMLLGFFVYKKIYSLFYHNRQLRLF